MITSPQRKKMEPCDALVADDLVAGDLHLLLENARVASDVSQVTFTYFSRMHDILLVGFQPPAFGWICMQDLVQELLPTSRGYSTGGRFLRKLYETG